jgi:hypothetical protein
LTDICREKPAEMRENLLFKFKASVQKMLKNRGKVAEFCKNFK